jgi:Bacteriophage baseplate protein W
MNVDALFHFDRRGRTAEVGEDTHVRQMIEQLLFTNPGERVNRPDFGSGLQQLVFAPNSIELAATVQFTTQALLQQHLGDLIDVGAIDVTADEASLVVSVSYAIRRTGRPATAVFPVSGGPA